jgi:hypothetical protein
MKGKVLFRNQRTTLQAKYNWDVSEILREIHAGNRGHYAAHRSLVSKAFRQRFFWLTAMADAEKIFKFCQGCQCYASKPHVPAVAELKTICPYHLVVRDLGAWYGQKTINNTMWF